MHGRGGEGEGSRKKMMDLMGRGVTKERGKPAMAEFSAPTTNFSYRADAALV